MVMINPTDRDHLTLGPKAIDPYSLRQHDRLYWWFTQSFSRMCHNPGQDFFLFRLFILWQKTQGYGCEERASENLLKQCTPRQLLQKQQKVKSTAPQSPNVQQSCAIDLFGWCSIRNRTVDQNVVANSKAKVCQPLVWSRFHRLEKLFWPTPVSWRNGYTNNNVKKFKSKQQLHDSMYI